MTVGSAIAAEPLPKLELPPVNHPRDNPATDAKVALGKRLFFDTRLSRTNRVSCATCHDPVKGWSNSERFGIGVDEKRGDRNVPTLFNVAYNRHFFWDGRSASLEQQSLQPIQNPAEMDMPLKNLVQKVNGIEDYRKQFRDVFGDRVTPSAIAKAIAAFERTIISRDVPLDHFIRGDKNALAPAAERGLHLFYGDARCHVCHSGPNFTDQKFHNIGVGIGGSSPDAGRMAISGRIKDQGAFKTPTLREIAHTAPYMHDGSFESLDDVVRHYNFGGVTEAENPNRDEALEVLYLSDDQTADLVTFLKHGLSNRRLPRPEAAKLPVKDE